MNDIRLIYYGEPGELRRHLLFTLNSVEQVPVADGREGLYICEKKFGTEDFRRLSLDPCAPEAENVLLCRYLSPEEISFIRENPRPLRYYVLAHRYLDLEHLRDAGIGSTQLWAICDYMNSPLFKDAATVRKALQTKNTLRLRSFRAVESGEEETARVAGLPLFVMFLLKVVLSPLNEVRRGLSLLKHSNLRIVSRLVELLYFLDFCVRAILFRALRESLRFIYYQLRFIIGLLRIAIIKCGYGIRHVLLMCGFKSFGVFVDGYQGLVRLKDLLLRLRNRLLDLVWYSWGYFFYYDLMKPALDFLRLRIWNFIRYRFGHFLYYSVGHFLYYRVGYYIYFVLIRGAGDFLKYRVRHWILMFLYRSYGAVYDAAMFLHRFSKNVLLYPVRKIYWFASFQYDKRLKKYFTRNA